MPMPRSSLRPSAKRVSSVHNGRSAAGAPTMAQDQSSRCVSRAVALGGHAARDRTLIRALGNNVACTAPPADTSRGGWRQASAHETAPRSAEAFADRAIRGTHLQATSLSLSQIIERHDYPRDLGFGGLCARS